ncbi:metalloproteinase inhibitor 3-like [Dreissena polymorpha]|uniref:NTR domain-containing protein n=1 Tax=Dreissena polymorpha TaxID=45954 RepID=A0A9D4S2L2_DREPO|nr:metalloproteinase inhibitor 3-like [Dreissena polymorpha]KAH3890234.1 hypothetical protein DPMN_014307 [Dreissena polymorpha]
MNIAYVLLALSAAVFCPGEACRCGIVEEKDRFCRAEWGMIGHVVSSTVVGDERVFGVIVRGSLKGNTGYSFLRVYTSTVGSLCGVKLGVNKDYLLAGSINQQRLYLGLCSIVRELTSAELLTYRPPPC